MNFRCRQRMSVDFGTNFFETIAFDCHSWQKPFRSHPWRCCLFRPFPRKRCICFPAMTSYIWKQLFLVCYLYPHIHLRDFCWLYSSGIELKNLSRVQWRKYDAIVNIWHLTNCVNREAVLERFVCSALRFIPHEPRKKTLISYIYNASNKDPFLKFSVKSYKIKISTVTGT